MLLVLNSPNEGRGKRQVNSSLTVFVDGATASEPAPAPAPEPMPAAHQSESGKVYAGTLRPRC